MYKIDLFIEKRKTKKMQKKKEKRMESIVDRIFNENTYDLTGKLHFPIFIFLCKQI